MLLGRGVKNVNVPIYEWTLVNIIHILPLFYFCWYRCLCSDWLVSFIVMIFLSFLFVNIWYNYICTVIKSYSLMQFSFFECSQHTKGCCSLLGVIVSICLSLLIHCKSISPLSFLSLVSMCSLQSDICLLVLGLLCKATAS